MPNVVGRFDSCSFDNLGTVVEVGLLPAACQGTDGQAEVVDERPLLLPHIGAAPASAFQQVILHELRQRLADRHPTHLIFACQFELRRDPVACGPFAAVDPPADVGGDLEVDRERRGAVDDVRRAESGG